MSDKYTAWNFLCDLVRFWFAVRRYRRELKKRLEGVGGVLGR